MTFLNAALLAGMAALAIPILIHLFHKSRFEVIPWGAMHLLETVIRTNQRRVKLEQLILLLVRAAIPLLLALAMARPIWKGAQALLGDAKTSTVVLLDNSYSMEASRAGLSNFSVARDEATKVVNGLKRGSDVQVVLMGEGGSTLVDAPTLDTARVAKALGAVTAGYGAATVPAALDFAGGVLGQMQESSRNVVLITDFQRISFSAQEDGSLGESIKRLKALPIPPAITMFDVGQEVRDNVAVESLEFPRLMVGVGQKVQIRGNLRNYGDANYPDLRVYFTVDGKERSESQVALGPRQSSQVLFTHSFDTAGSHVVEVSADADALKADNTSMASIPVRDRMPVLLVNGDPGNGPLKGETDFAEIALQPYSAGRVELADRITTRVIRPEELQTAALANTAVVILANVRKLEDPQLRALEEWVRRGGGLLVFPGDRLDAGWYTDRMHAGGKGLYPAPLTAPTGDPAESTPGVAIVAERFENPALELFNDPRNGTLSESAVRRWHTLVPPPGAEVLARLDNGDPFLVEKAYGDGRVIAAATTLDADWSNLPLRPSYLPLLQRLTVYLASTVNPPRNLDVGRSLVAFMPVEAAGKNASLLLPGGANVQVPIVKRGDRGVAEYPGTQRPGLYTLTAPDGGVMHYVANASRRESDLQKLTLAEQQTLAKAHGVNLVHSGAEYARLDHSQRYGHEMWKGLLWAMLGLCFGELFLQQRFGRVRRAAVAS